MNRLADQTSPYLRQHAENPVDWWPWGDEAFAEARRRDVPVLLSVGYSACHWCHVMAHESFEDDEVAAVVNELFVSIKVDREERPDVDAVYMEATQAMTGAGGWPMTVFMTPEGEPFFCGTYFPREKRPGMPGFLDVCRAIDDAWTNRRAEVVEQGGKLAEHLRQTLAAAPGSRPVPGAEVVDAAVAGLIGAHDEARGGFGGAPKFPQPASVELLLRAASRHAGDLEGDDGTALRAATTTLDHMAAGGIYDHLGGGFARYSVDARWLVPHFEKMLYDQALLIRSYLHAWQLTGAPRHRQVVDETITYVLRDLRHPAGGFFSAEDADSEGEEGRFYVWTPDEVRSALGPDEAVSAMEWWGVTEEGNFTAGEAQPSGPGGAGRTILNRLHAVGRIERPPLIQDCRLRLFDARGERVRPGLDDKVLTEWNGLMLATLAEAAAATGNRAWLEAAVQAGEFLCLRMRSADGRWLRSWQGDPTDPEATGRAHQPAFAADHAALVDGFTRLAEATGQARWMAVARATADVLLALFRDTEGSGFFTTGADAEALVARPKDLQDGATPSANSNAAWALLRLAALTGERAYRDAAEEVLALLGPLAGEHPLAFAHLAAGVDLHARGSTEVVIPGSSLDLVGTVQQRWLPDAVLAWGEPYPSPLWEGRTEGHAYVCQGYSCRLPTTDPAVLTDQLTGSTH
ncbi:thioredoxin domain-containing protein [Iamia sp. SCSIO 61187]|uniref:thioredoxin domain-containing protein n=1 Tax=Iamia sp. SCSIO 61187 TaxID=2722752 RepID=UPI001C62DD3D|nr:thioredoxin domain-containing protein [Iamia sp. SCSIO 61187]QYG93129.1 thioredoxin domain-containing protein [Iamia sp. SCSIO 61187]